MKVGDKIKSIRLSLGMTMEEFGHYFKTSKGTVNNWEKGRNLPNKENLKIIADLGGISVKELLGEGGCNEPGRKSRNYLERTR